MAATTGTEPSAAARNKENQKGSGSGSGAARSPTTDAEMAVEGAAASSAGSAAAVTGGSGSGSGTRAAAEPSRMRLRESTNTAMQRSNGVGGGVGGVAGGCPLPASAAQYYALSSRGGAAQPLSDLDFVSSLLSGATGSGVAGARKRATSATGGARSSAQRETAAVAVTSAYSKARPSSSFARGPTRGSVQAW